jgi:uncharacterized protein (UPF0335 family)
MYKIPVAPFVGVRTVRHLPIIAFSGQQWSETIPINCCSWRLMGFAKGSTHPTIFGCLKIESESLQTARGERSRHPSIAVCDVDGVSQAPSIPAQYAEAIIGRAEVLALTRWSFLYVHFHDLIQQRGTMSGISIPGGRIRSFVERIENLDTELQELNESKKEVFSEAKAEGFDVKILKEIIKLRKQDQDERDERDTLLDMYMRAMETAGPEQAAKAA